MSPYSMLQVPCCCKADDDDDGGGGGDPRPICDDLCDCIASGRYEGLDIVGASYSGTQFSIAPAVGNRWIDDYRLSLVEVRVMESYTTPCFQCGDCKLHVRFEADIRLEVTSSACVGDDCTSLPGSGTVQLSGVPLTSTTGGGLGSTITIGCDCCFPNAFNFLPTFGAGLNWDGILVCSNGDAVGRDEAYGSFSQRGEEFYDLPAEVFPDCGEFATPMKIQYTVDKGFTNQFSNVCQGDITTDPPTDPFVVELTLQPKRSP